MEPVLYNVLPFAVKNAFVLVRGTLSTRLDTWHMSDTGTLALHGCMKQRFKIIVLRQGH